MRTMFLICLALGTCVLSPAPAVEKGKTDLKAAVVGKWQATDAYKQPAEFFMDGTAIVGGFVDGKRASIKGTWTITEKGLVEFEGTIIFTELGMGRLKHAWDLTGGNLLRHLAFFELDSGERHYILSSEYPVPYVKIKK